MKSIQSVNQKGFRFVDWLWGVPWFGGGLGVCLAASSDHTHQRRALSSLSPARSRPEIAEGKGASFAVLGVSRVWVCRLQGRRGHGRTQPLISVADQCGSMALGLFSAAERPAGQCPDP